MHTALLIPLVAAQAAAIALEPRVTNLVDSDYASNEPPAPTPGPSLAKAGLKRDSVIVRRSASQETCGYIDRIENFALYCNPGYSCAYFPVNGIDYSSFGIGGFATAAAACCTGNANGIIWDECMPATSCADYNGQQDIETTVGLDVYCGSSQPKCATYQFQGLGSASYFSSFPASSSLAAETYTHLFCTDVATIELVYQSYTTSYDFSSSSSSSAPAGGSLQSTTALSPANSHSASASPTHHASSNVGVIAGATVGGVVALALIGAVVGYLVFRKKQERVAPSPEVSQWSGNSWGGSTAGNIPAFQKHEQYPKY